MYSTTCIDYDPTLTVDYVAPDAIKEWLGAAGFLDYEIDAARDETVYAHFNGGDVIIPCNLGASIYVGETDEASPDAFHVYIALDYSSSYEDAYQLTFEGSEYTQPCDELEDYVCHTLRKSALEAFSEQIGLI